MRETTETADLTLRLYVRQLEREFAEICWYFGIKMQKPHFVIKDSQTQWGSWDPNTRVITLSRRLVVEHTWDIVVEILKHEMAHQIVSELFRAIDENHGSLFRKACQMLAVSAWAQRAAVDMDGEPLKTWRENLHDTSENQETLRLIRRVEKLLQLAQSSNEHESLLAMQTVRELYRKHNIKTFQVEADRNFVHALLNLERKVVTQADTMISIILSRHFFVETITTPYFDVKTGNNTKALEILGTRENVLMAEYVFYYLRHSTELLWKAFKKHTGTHGSAKKSYILGVLTGFEEKLSKQSEAPAAAAATEADGESSLPAVTKHEIMRAFKRELEGFMRYRHPRTRKRSWSTSSGNQASYKAGQVAGRSLTISKAVTHSGSSAPRLLPSS